MERPYYKYKEFLQNFKTHFSNPFLNKNFELNSVDACADTFDHHLIDGIELDFSKNLEIKVTVPAGKEILGLAIINYIISDSFLEDFSGFYVNEKEIKLPERLEKSNEWISNFLFLYDKIRNLKDYKFIIEYKDTRSGRNYFYHYHQLVFFIVDEDHPDFYFYEKEVNRRNKIINEKK